MVDTIMTPEADLLFAPHDDPFTDDEWAELLTRAPKHAQLEHSLAVNFVKMQRERVPEKRQTLWMECLRLSAELEKLSDESNKM